MSNVRKLSGQGKPGTSRLATLPLDSETEWRITVRRSPKIGGPVSIDMREYKRRGEVFVPTDDGLRFTVESVEAFWKTLSKAVELAQAARSSKEDKRDG